MIIQPFNALFCAIFALALTALIISSLALRRKSESTRRHVLIIASGLTFIGFIAYKIALSRDAEFDALTGGFNWWGELPLQLCNINMLLLPIAVATNKRPLLSFCFFVGALGATMALVMPGIGFEGYSILLPRMLGYYGTHIAIMIEALALVTFGLYQPEMRDLPWTALALLVIALVIFGINRVLRISGLHPNANYFFVEDAEGNPLLKFFHGWIPYPFLYLLPCFGILGAYMAAVMVVFRAILMFKRSRGLPE